MTSTDAMKVLEEETTGYVKRLLHIAENPLPSERSRPHQRLTNLRCFSWRKGTQQSHAEALKLFSLLETLRLLAKVLCSPKKHKTADENNMMWEEKLRFRALVREHAVSREDPKLLRVKKQHLDFFSLSGVFSITTIHTKTCWKSTFINVQ